MTQSQYQIFVALVNTWGNLFPLEHYKTLSDLRSYSDEELVDEISKFGWELDLSNTSVEYGGMK